MAPANTARQGRVKPTGRLADVAATKKSKTVLLGAIQQHVIAESAKFNDRRRDVIHPSEMAKADWCPRQTYYRIAEYPETNKVKANSVQLETIFEEGNEIHSKWQTWARAVHGSSFTPEADVHSGLIHGHADGVLVMDDLAAVLEIKSIGLGTLRFEDAAILRDHLVETVDGKKIYDLEAIWKAIRRPLPSHQRQAQIYLYCLRENQPDLLFDTVIFLYEYKPTQAAKEFVVKYNPDIVEPLLESVKDIEYALESKKPPHRAHVDKDSAACKACAWRGECWGDDGSSTEEEGSAPEGRQPRSGGRTARARGGDAAPAGPRRPRSARRSDGPGRLGTDEPVRPPHPVERVHGNPTGGSRGRREVVRGRS